MYVNCQIWINPSVKSLFWGICPHHLNYNSTTLTSCCFYGYYSWSFFKSGQKSTFSYLYLYEALCYLYWKVLSRIHYHLGVKSDCVCVYMCGPAGSWTTTTWRRWAKVGCTACWLCSSSTSATTPSAGSDLMPGSSARNSVSCESIFFFSFPPLFTFFPCLPPPPCCYSLLTFHSHSELPTRLWVTIVSSLALSPALPHTPVTPVATSPLQNTHTQTQTK